MLHFAATNFSKKEISQQAEQPVVRPNRALRRRRLILFNFLLDEVFRVERGRWEGRVASEGPETRPSPLLSFIFKSMSISMSPSPPPAINMTFRGTGCAGIDAEGEKER